MTPLNLLQDPDFYQYTWKTFYKQSAQANCAIYFKMERATNRILDCKWTTQNMDDWQASLAMISEYITGLMLQEVLEISESTLDPQGNELDLALVLNFLKQNLRDYKDLLILTPAASLQRLRLRVKVKGI